LALLKINRVRRQIPVHDRMAVVMEVEAFLPNGRAGQDERPEWRVEGRPYLTGTVSVVLVFPLLLTETGREAGPHTPFRARDGLGLGIDPDVVDTNGSGAKADRLDHLLRNGSGSLIGRYSPHAKAVLED